MARNPGEVFADDPAVFALALAGSLLAAGAFAWRSARSRGARRLGWGFLALLEIGIAAGIVRQRDQVRRRK